MERNDNPDCKTLKHKPVQRYVRVNADCCSSESFRGLMKSIKGISTGNIYPLFPLTATIFPTLLIGISYCLAVTGDHDISLLPYPSDLGELQPERGFFSLGLSVTISLTLPCIIFRYIQINDLGYPEQRQVNVFGAISGILHVFGLAAVFSFSFSESMVGHYIGAFIYFVFGIVYIIIQSRLSQKIPKYHPRFIVYLRGVCAFVAFIAAWLYFFARLLAPKEESRYYLPQCGEWIGSASFMIFNFSFCYDFNGLWCSSENMYYEVPYHNEKLKEIIERLQERIDERQKVKEEDCNSVVSVDTRKMSSARMVKVAEAEDA